MDASSCARTASADYCGGGAPAGGPAGRKPASGEPGGSAPASGDGGGGGAGLGFRKPASGEPGGRALAGGGAGEDPVGEDWAGEAPFAEVAEAEEAGCDPLVGEGRVEATPDGAAVAG